MTATASKTASTTFSAPDEAGGLGARIYAILRRAPLWFIVAIWTIPSLGLFVSSFRTRDDQRSSGWWTAITNPDFTTENYRDVLDSSGASNLWDGLLASFAIAVPATIIPIAIACMAAYAFAWIDFRGREWLFIITVALLAIPPQIALLPLLQTYSGGAHWTIPGLDKTITIFPDLNLAGESMSAWLTHTSFAMPFAIFLLHNYISSLPKDIFEAARIDGADHFTVFWRLVLPLSVPVIAAFAIFQFLWTWNDYLIAFTMIGANPDNLPATVLIANLAGQFGTTEHLLTAGAFVQAAIPIAVFFALQRFFVRGLLAGSVKG